MEHKQNFEQMFKVAAERIGRHGASAMALLSGTRYISASNVIEVESFGVRYELSLKDLSCTPQMNNWLHLVLLHYLDLAGGRPVWREVCGFGDMKDGLVRGTDFDRRAEAALSRIFNGLMPSQIRKICEILGGREIKSNADLCIEFYVFPRLPMVLKLWFVDDEFPVTGKLMPTRSADAYLTVEDAVTVGEVILLMLERERNI